MGQPHRSGGEGEEATRLRQLRDHLRLQPDDGAAWLALAQLLASRTAGPELHHALEQAIQSSPENTDAWLVAARVHRRERGDAAAQQWLNHWSRRNPELAAPRTAAAALRAEVARQAGQWQEALNALREVEKSRPKDPVTLNEIGSCLASMEAWGEAAGYFVEALRLLPDLAEARLNLGLLRACQRRDDAALQELDRVLALPGIAPATRAAAETLRQTLREHHRLQPALDQALQTGAIDNLQQALNATPGLLSKPDPASVERLRALVAPCRSLDFDWSACGDGPGSDELEWLEACVQCNADDDVQVLADQLARPRKESPAHQRIRSMQEIIRERAGLNPAVLTTAEGEAWLKYWHARLLADEPDKRPGQYKLTTNAIGSLPLTPPENVAGTLRTMVTEVLPDLPPGPARGLFLYIGVTMIHGFGDGNGRLARFLLAWESARAGLTPVLVPQALRARTAQASVTAWLEADLRPFAAALEAACAERNRLLRRLSRRAPPVSF